MSRCTLTVTSHSTQMSPQQLSTHENPPVDKEAILTCVNNLTTASCSYAFIHCSFKKHLRTPSSTNDSQSQLTIRITCALPPAIALVSVEWGPCILAFKQSTARFRITILVLQDIIDERRLTSSGRLPFFTNFLSHHLHPNILVCSFHFTGFQWYRDW